MILRRCMPLALALLCLAPAPAAWGYEQLDSFYGIVGVAGLRMQNQDLNQYYGGDAFAPGMNLVYDLAFGWQFSQPFAVECGFTVGPYRYASGSNLWYNGNTLSWDEVTSTRDEYTYTFYVMPALRLTGPGLGGKPMLHTLGLKLGGSSLYGTETFNDLDTGATRTQTNTGTGDYYAVVYRLEQMVNHNLSLGLEIGYASNVFNEVDYSNGSYRGTTGGTYFEPLDFGWNGANTSADGSTERADYSGPYVKMTVAGWFMPAYRRQRPKVSDPFDPGDQVVPTSPGFQ